MCAPRQQRAGILVALLLAAVPAPARADESAASAAAGAVAVSGSAGLGAGMFGAHPQSLLDLGVDAEAAAGGGLVGAGLGARLRWVAGEGFRTADWDSAPDWLRLVRYLGYRRGHAAAGGAALSGEPAFEIVAGELGGVRLGDGAVIDGYSAGLVVDQHHLGIAGRLRHGRVAVESVVDDVVSPRVAAGRATYRVSPWLIAGASLAADLAAPSGQPDSSGAMPASRALPFAVGDLRLERSAAGGRLELAATGDLAAAGLGAGLFGVGLHLGGEAASVLEGSVRLRGRVELSAGNGAYTPGWIGPLYESERRTAGPAGGDGGAAMGLRDAAAAGALGGIGAAAELSVDAPDLGSAALLFRHRPWLGDAIAGRIAVPCFRQVQAAAWAAAALRPGGSQALALELRARLPSHLYASLEVAHLFTAEAAGADADAPAMEALVPLWLVTATVGVALGD
jgi:hypothetical protein